MNIKIYPSHTGGQLAAISSKSVAHRMLICAALGKSSCTVRCDNTNNDIDATAACLAALGAKIKYESPFFDVTPIAKGSLPSRAVLPVGESGSTLRFILPIAAALGVECELLLRGRLPQRPLSPLSDELCRHGVSLRAEGNSLFVSGKLSGSDFYIDGGVSSQFVSGLLFALSILPYQTTLTVTGNIESQPYISLTENALSDFGVQLIKTQNKYTLSPKRGSAAAELLTVEGDWSNAAFPLCMGVIGSGSVTVGGLHRGSAQGDREIVDILRRFGANITEGYGEYTAHPSQLHGIDIDATHIPDLVPVLATVAAAAEGETNIYGAARLRLKESDRLVTTAKMLSDLGARVVLLPDGLRIIGNGHLAGGYVSSENDHRIAMSAAVASLICSSSVEIEGAEAVSKSYPDFWADMHTLGLKFNESELGI